MKKLVHSAAIAFALCISLIFNGWGVNALYAQEFTQELMPPCRAAGDCENFPGCNVICNKTIQRLPCTFGTPPVPAGIAGIFYACDFPIPGWGQVAGSCDYFENTILDPDGDMVGSIGIFGANTDPHRSEIPYIVANIQPNTDYLLSYVRRSVSEINITVGANPLPLIANYTLEPTHLEICTYNSEDFHCESWSEILALLPYPGSTLLLSDNRFGGANPPFAWKQIVAAVSTNNPDPAHNSIYCYLRRAAGPGGAYYLEIDHFEMIRDVFIPSQTIALDCRHTEATIGDPALCANTDLLNMRYRWFQSINGGTTWQLLSDLDNQTSITVSPTITTQYKLVRYMAQFFEASDGTIVPIETIDSPTNTVQKEAIITVIPYYFTDPASSSPDITLPTGATINWQPGAHPFLPQFTGSPTNPIRINGTITIPSSTTLNITDLHFDFGPNGRILVHPSGRLNLRGANLSGDPICNNMWQGIRTFGGGTSPIVSTNSSATNPNTIISDALIGISTQNLPLFNLNNINADLVSIPDFNTITNLTNFLFPALWSLPVINSADCILGIEYTRFENCFMGINTAWKPSHNDLIRQTTFTTTGAGLLFPFNNIAWITQGEAGIFSMFSPRLSADACTFQNLKYGIRTNVVADFKAPNQPALSNTFTNCRVGISARNFTSAAFANTNIRNNLFTNCETAIQCQGTNANIRGNTINSGVGLSSVGMLMLGSAYVIANNNQIANVSRGIVSLDTDLLGGFIHGNTIANAQVAIPNIGDNTSVTIMCNTLNNYQLTAISVAPWLTTAQTGILANQGNCPTFNTALNTFAPPAGGPLFPDLYLYPTNTNLYTYSEYAQMLPPGFTASPGVLSLCDGFGPPPANWSPIDICNQFAPQRIPTAADVKNLTDEREQEIQTSLWIQHYAEQGDTAQLTAFLAELNNRIALRYRIQQHLQEASATAILSLLDALPQEREEDEHYDYFYRLLLNLRQTARTVFDITAEEEAQLLQIAHSKTATAYKAQALLFIARGHEFIVTLPELDLDWQTAFKAQPHAAALQGEVHLVSGFYPNPASHTVQLNYNLTTTNSTPDKATIQMYNILGKPVFTATISGAGTYTLPLENFEEGLYYYTVVLTNNRQVLKGDKLLITK